jgi:predicted 2-oxoglutarate/Fe(II)-dependent dioxygenase YbiX
VEPLPVELLGHLGLFVAPDVLEPGACRLICGAMTAASGALARVWDGESDAVDTTVRRSRTVEVDSAAAAVVSEALDRVREPLARHFGVLLGSFQPPQFLLYRQGDFFDAHSDSDTDPAASEAVRERQVSAVLFLNAAGESGAYEGGALTFYGLFDGGVHRGDTGLAIAGAPGSLVAFPSEVVHAVKPVTRGERCTVVTWFC